MPKNPIPIAIFALCVVAAAIGYFIFAGEESTRYRQTQAVINSPSVVNLRMHVDYDRGAVASEEYKLQDSNGRSTAQYTIVAQSGKTYTITSPPSKTYTVPFFFEKLEQDGLWKVTSQPPRGDTTSHYTIAVEQTVQNEQGSRLVKFTDPHYWATTAGRQFQIHLDKNKPTPDLLKMSSKALADPRYQQLVDDFRTFGTPGFRRKVEQVQANVRAGR